MLLGLEPYFENHCLKLAECLFLETKSALTRKSTWLSAAAAEFMCAWES